MIPDQRAFLQASKDDVRSVAPSTVLFCPGGTRRAGVLAGMEVPSEDFVRWSVRELLGTVTRLFDNGVAHVFTGIIFPLAWREATPKYRALMAQWSAWCIAGDEQLREYRRLGWCVRAPGALLFPPELGVARAAKIVEESTPKDAKHTLWLQCYPSNDAATETMLREVLRVGARTREEAVLALYGKAIPQATLLISSGKPATSPIIVPPLLHGDLHAYWMQRPGNTLTELEIRTIFYDMAFTRATWSEDKTGREQQVLEHRTLWENAPILGLGRRVGPFWFPSNGESDE